MGYELIAAVDLGSNSFRLQVGRVVDDQIYPLDGLKESVRLAAGLTAQKLLDGASQLRALEALRKFNERLRGFAPGAVRAVATNTLRVAKNAPQFLMQAEAALGFPIEVIAGREEARLIYVGVAHTLPDPKLQQLVVDIGGGSTEFIIGRSFEPLELESLYMGCVGFTTRFFPDGRIDKRGMKEAELAARSELHTIVHGFRETGWEAAVGSSGTAKALVDLLELNGFANGDITREGLDTLRASMLRAGSLQKLQLAGLRADRIPVLPGGFAIMSAIFKEFGLERMAFSEGALRLGVLYDLLGRYHHRDLRDASVLEFTRRYQVEAVQAQRVAETARAMFAQLRPRADDGENADARMLDWAAHLHEVGISVAHSSYHKHSAYILANADMPGFSRMDQGRLARVVLAHRGKLERVQTLDPDSPDWKLIFCLRLAVLLNRARDDSPIPDLSVHADNTGFVIEVPVEWLEGSPLTAAALEEEERQWAGVGKTLRVRAPRDSSARRTAR